MKVKRFNNLWAMGLILFGALLIAFYIAKIFFPEFIIGVAETPRIVKIGTIIQSNKWYLHLFNIITGYIYGYILFCACCRTYKLNCKGNLILLSSLLVLAFVMEFYPEHYNTINYFVLVITPFFICLSNKNVTKETFTSTAICFSLDLVFQVFSLLVRNLPLMANQPNIITILILLIDGFIWRIIFYLFFNYKIKEKGE